jgi:large subunit ribosomal protein L4
MALEVPLRDLGGAERGKLPVDEGVLGGVVKNRLMHAAAVMVHANMRAGTACTKTRGEISGSTRKLYRQKGTGNARAGSRKSGLRYKGGIIHGPKPRDFSFRMPQRQRIAALRSAVLAKVLDNEVLVVDGLKLAEPKTQDMLGTLEKLGLRDRKSDGRPTVLVATDGVDRNVYLSARNLPGVAVVPVQDLNAREVLTHARLLFSRPAFDAFMKRAAERAVKHARKPKGTRKRALSERREASIAEGQAAAQQATLGS